MGIRMTSMLVTWNCDEVENFMGFTFELEVHNRCASANLY
jgi:hypothetical protein